MGSFRAPMLSSAHPSTFALTRVLIDPEGLGDPRFAVRRVYLFRKDNGLLLELQVAFIEHEFSSKSLNTQLAVAADLSFFCEWCRLQQEKDADWISPERRAARGLLALRATEIRDVARWAQKTSDSLSKGIKACSRGASAMPLGTAVTTQLRNRRLRNVSAYIEWLTTQLAHPLNKPDADDATRAELRRASVHHEFKKRLAADPKSAGPLALTPAQHSALLQALANSPQLWRGSHGTRDKLIIELLLQGVRAGELLKVQVGDIDEKFDLGRRKISIVSIVRRPNDRQDSRAYEPAVKTRPGELPIPKLLAAGLIDYVLGPRREAINRSNQLNETPYLFVCHSGPNVGNPITQRNLSRIAAKLQQLPGLPPEFSPHLLRHTHMTIVRDRAQSEGKSDQHIRAVLVLRGRWSDSSAMPFHYTGRSVMEDAADLVEERDSRLEPK